jgi:hypothetical protein
VSRLYRAANDTFFLSTTEPGTDFEACILQVLDQWHEAHRQQFIRDGFTNSLATFDTAEEKHAHVGAKYIRLDVGGSGAWMLEIATGVIYSILGYGKVDKKKVAGNINDPQFNGAVLFRDRFRRGRFDNRTCESTLRAEQAQMQA